MTPGAATSVRSQQLAFLGVFVSGLLCITGIGAALPALPRYVTGPIGAGDVAVGVVIGAFAAGAVLGRPFAGRAADARGRRTVLSTGALLMALAGGLLFVPAGVPGLIAARLLLGLGEALVFTAGATWVVDLSAPGRRGQAIGLFGLSVWAGLSIGTLAGELLLAVSGFAAVWALTAAAPLLASLLARRLLHPHRPPEPSEPRGGLFTRAALRPGLSLALASAGYATMASFVVLHLAANAAGGGALVFTTFTATVVAARLLAGRLPDRLGGRPCAIAAGVSQALGLGLIAIAESTVVALGGALLLGAGFSLLFPALALLVVDRVGARRRGAALGSFTAFFDVGVGVGAPLAGAVASLSGYPAAFGIAAVLSGVAALVVLLQRVPPQGDSATVATVPSCRVLPFAVPQIRIPEYGLSDGRVRLRRWRESDVPALVEACRDPEIPRWTVVPSPYSEVDARAFVAGQNERLSRGEAAPFAVVDAEEGRFLGSIEVSLLDRRSGRGEIGYWVAAKARRQGVALRAVGILSEWALGELALERLELLVEPDNQPSQGVAEAAGYTREGVLRSYRPMKGRRPDFIVFSLLPTDAPAREALGRAGYLTHTGR